MTLKTREVMNGLLQQISLDIFKLILEEFLPHIVESVIGDENPRLDRNPFQHFTELTFLCPEFEFINVNYPLICILLLVSRLDSVLRRKGKTHLGESEVRFDLLVDPREFIQALEAQGEVQKSQEFQNYDLMHDESSN